MPRIPTKEPNFRRTGVEIVGPKYVTKPCKKCGENTSWAYHGKTDPSDQIPNYVNKHIWTCTKCMSTFTHDSKEEPEWAPPEEPEPGRFDHIKAESFTISQDTEIILDGRRYLLEVGDKIIIGE